MHKMDGVATRTAADLEQKLNLGKRFAEVMGIATDARETAEKAVSNLDEKLTPEEIFNLLTNNGAWQGIYRDDDGKVYINAEYIDACYFTQKAAVFLEPTEAEVTRLRKHIGGEELIPDAELYKYDFNGDGQYTSVDCLRATRAMQGLSSLPEWMEETKSEVTLTIDLSNPDKVIHIKGTNMWGSEVDRYIGVNFTNIKNPDTEQKLRHYIVESSTDDIWVYEKWSNGVAKCWGRLDSSCDITSGNSNAGGTVVYHEKLKAFPTALFVDTPIVMATACDGGSGCATASDDGSTQFTCKVTIWGAESASSGDVNIMAVGRWE